MQKKFTTITGFRPSKPLKNVFGPKAPLPIRKWVGSKTRPKGDFDNPPNHSKQDFGRT